MRQKIDIKIGCDTNDFIALTEHLVSLGFSVDGEWILNGYHLKASKECCPELLEICEALANNLKNIENAGGHEHAKLPKSLWIEKARAIIAKTKKDQS